MTPLGGPDFQVTPALHDHVRRRAGAIRRRWQRRGAATLVAAVLLVGFAVALIPDRRTKPDTVTETVTADQLPIPTGPPGAAPIPRLADHLVPAEAIARISPELELSRGNVPGEDYIVGVAEDALPADAGVARLWSRGYSIPPDPPVPDLITQISTEIIDYPDGATAAATLDRLAAANADNATRVDLADGFVTFVPEIPESARELPSSSEWFGVARYGEHLVVLRLRAIGTADWTPQFVDLLEAADAAGAGLDE
jgi:hypothetical protein